MMDPKLLYIVTERLKFRIVWEPSPNAGWQYCGRSEDLDTTLTLACIGKHFPDTELFYVSNRRDGRMLTSEEIISLVRELIDQQDLWFWSRDLQRAMHFKDIGVFRFGMLERPALHEAKSIQNS